MATFIDDSVQDTQEEISQVDQGQDQSQEEPTQDTPQEQVPERYKGKSATDLIRMHQEAEKLMGRHSQEVGELRRIVDDFVKAQVVTKEAPQDEEVDFFSNPQKAVEQAVSRHPKIKEAEALNAQMLKAQALNALQTAHPDYADIINDDGFKEWVAKSKVRSELLSRADQRYDFDAADDLLTTWKERQQMLSNTVEMQKADRKQQLRQASTGSVKGTGEAQSKKIYRRADIVDLMRKDPDRYMSLQPEIMAAYAEGRVR